MGTRRRPGWAPASIGAALPLLLALAMPGARGQQVEVCPDASWHGALLLKSYDSRPPSFFANITVRASLAPARLRGAWPSGDPAAPPQACRAWTVMRAQSWSATEFKDYALQDLSKAYIPSAVFLGIGLLSLAVLVAWCAAYLSSPASQTRVCGPPSAPTGRCTAQP